MNELIHTNLEKPSVRNYSIKDLEQLSGIKAHTLRIWEQRYNLLCPKRTETNIRYYDDKDLKFILNVALLNENGFKISKIAKMTSNEITQEVLKLAEGSFTFKDQISALIYALVDMDKSGFEQIISATILKIGFENTMVNVIQPFLSKIGVLWQTGAIHPAQEHFISNLVRQKLIVAIDGLTKKRGGKKFLLFLPEGELHEISLLFSSYQILSHKYQVVYLGQNTPDEDLDVVYKLHQPDYLLTVATTSPAAENMQSYIDSLSKRFPKSGIFISGLQVLRKKLKIPPNIHVMTTLTEFKKHLLEIDNM